MGLIAPPQLWSSLRAGIALPASFRASSAHLLKTPQSLNSFPIGVGLVTSMVVFGGLGFLAARNFNQKYDTYQNTPTVTLPMKTEETIQVNPPQNGPF